MNKWNEWLKKYGDREDDSSTCKKALKAAIRRWKGLRPSCLRAHDVDFDEAKGATDCALCEWANKQSRLTGESTCTSCPLFLVRGRYACDTATAYETWSPYTLACHDADIHDVKPLRAWLALALQYYKDNMEEHVR